MTLNRALVGILIATIVAAVAVVAVQSFHHTSHVLAKTQANVSILAPHKHVVPQHIFPVTGKPLPPPLPAPPSHIQVAPPAPVQAPQPAPQPSPQPNAAPQPVCSGPSVLFHGKCVNNGTGSCVQFHDCAPLLPGQKPLPGQSPPPAPSPPVNNGAPSEGCGTPEQCLNQ